MRHCPGKGKVSNIYCQKSWRWAWAPEAKLRQISKPLLTVHSTIGNLQFHALLKSESNEYSFSWKLVNSQKGWNEINAFFFKRNKSLDKLEWRRRSRGNKKTSGTIYRVTATLPGTLETVSALLRDVNNMGSWNQVFQSSHVVESLDRDMMISYQITATNKSLLFPRDFVYGLKFGKSPFRTKIVGFGTLCQTAL